MPKIDSLLVNPEFIADLKGDDSARVVAQRWGRGKTFVQKYRDEIKKKNGLPTAMKMDALAATFEKDAEGNISGSTGILPEPLPDISNDSLMRQFGRDPQKYKLVGHVAERHWYMNERWNHWYGFKAIEVDPDVEEVDGLAILRDLRASIPAEDPYQATGDGAFVFSLNDTQFGKAEGGGTAGTLARVQTAVHRAAERILALRSMGYDLGTLVLIGGGDIIEGCTIFPNQQISLDLDRRGQINTAVGTILNVLDTLAPMFEKVIVLAARGNHGENRIDGKRTTLYDNDDTMVFEMARLATERDPKLQHIEYVIADDQAGVSTEVAGWRLGTTHGDVYAKGVTGATVFQKVLNWMKNMSLGRDPMGLCDVLITHHFHHEQAADFGAWEWHQTRAQDGGSEYFRQSSGQYSEPGTLTFVMTPQKRFAEQAYL